MTRVAVVVPSVGRTTLPRTLAPLLGRVPVTVVDDRPVPSPPLDLPEGVRVLTSGGLGPAAARNTGWRATDAEWVAFLDDDVYPPDDWVSALLADLDGAAPDVGGSQGRIVVPLPADRRPTDWERSTAGLATAVWATADLAYRRAALEQVGGFDERFPRAYREDADLGLRVTQAGWRIVHGARCVEHPVRPTSWWTSVRVQRGNADDVLMRALHGPSWRAAASVPAGRRPWHLATSASLLLAVAGALAGRRGLARAGLAVWAGLTVDFGWRRTAPGPRTPHEVATMAVTSAVLPLAATGHWLRGHLRVRSLVAAGGPAPAGPLRAPVTGDAPQARAAAPA